jgi:soluble lytic murein transglycosylase-like protein
LLRFVLPFVLAGAAMLAIAVRPAALAVGPLATPPPPTQREHQPVPEESRSDHELILQSSVQERAAAPAVQAAAQPSVQDIIREAFQPLGDPYVDWAEKIAFCESTYDPNAVNSASGAQGLFQFLPSTWRGTPFASASPFDPRANSQAAAWLLQTYGPSQWECRA